MNAFPRVACVHHLPNPHYAVSLDAQFDGSGLQRHAGSATPDFFQILKRIAHSSRRDSESQSRIRSLQ